MLRTFLPYKVFFRLFGDRKRFGLKIIPDDPCWQEWEKIAIDTLLTEKNSDYNAVHNSGYKILNNIDMTRQKVLEIGACDLSHHRFWNSKPKEYYVLDVSQDGLKLSQKILESIDVPCKTMLIKNSSQIPVKEIEVDIVLSFYSLEHIFSLETYLLEIKRILKPGGF